MLPSDWDKAVFRGILAPDSYEFYFFCRVTNKYIGSYDLIKSGVSTKSQMYAAYQKIRKIACDEQKSIAGDKWCSFTFRVDSDGDFSFDYEYDSPLSYDDWKAKYLV